MIINEIGFTIGEKVTRHELEERLGAPKQQGVFRSGKFASMIVITGTESIYWDRWEENGEVLIYTGQGLVGDQSMTGNNKKLYDAWKRDDQIHIFEKQIHGQYYEYKGAAVICEKPSKEIQPDENNNNRWVKIFKMRLIKGQ